MKNKIYSGIDSIPNGIASDKITPGCLVLEGGAFRTIYEEGVLDVLMENGINLSCVIGVSAGALNGVNYVSGNIGKSARANLRYRNDPRYIGLDAIKTDKSIVGFSFMFNELNNSEPLNYERLLSGNQRLIAVATSLKSSKEEYFELGEYTGFIDVLRASASLPYVSKPVEINGTPYLDGGCACSIPYQWAIDNGYEKIVVVRTQDKKHRKKFPEKANNILLHTYRSYPEFSLALSRYHEKYNSQCNELDRLEKEKRIFVIAPSKPISTVGMKSDTESLGELYYLGYNDALKLLDKLKSYLNCN